MPAAGAAGAGAPVAARDRGWRIASFSNVFMWLGVVSWLVHRKGWWHVARGDLARDCCDCARRCPALNCLFRSRRSRRSRLSLASLPRVGSPPIPSFRPPTPFPLLSLFVQVGSALFVASQPRLFVSFTPVAGGFPTVNSSAWRTGGLFTAAWILWCARHIPP
jgi:hypothetical protein